MTAERASHRDRGAVLMLTAISLGFIVLATAFTIDIGRQIMRRRDMQAIADVVSLDMVREINGRTVDAINADGGNWNLAIQRSAQRNNFTASKLTVVLGHVETVNNVESFHEDFGSTIPTAVQVTAADTINYFFVPGTGNVTRTAVAQQEGTVDYEFGSFLASVSPNATQVDLLNKVITRALGNNGSFQIDAVSYQGLADAHVSIRQISTQMGLGSPDQLAYGTVNARQFLEAVAQAMQANGASSAAVTAMQRAETTVDSSEEFDFSAVAAGTNASASSGSGNDAFDTEFSALGYLTGAAFVINGNSFLSIPKIDLGVPGFGEVDIGLTVIHAPVYVYGAKAGATAQTSQVQMTISMPISSLDVSSVPGMSTLLPGVSQLSLNGQVQVDPSVGAATSTVDEVNCGVPTNSTKNTVIGITAQPVSVKASEDLTLSGVLPLVGQQDILRSTVDPPATVSATGASQDGFFDYTSDFLPSVGSGSPRRLGAATLDLSSALQATSANTTILNRGGFADNVLLNAMNLALNSKVFSVISNQIVPLLTQTLGLDLGGADVGALDLHCNAASLAI